MKWWKLLSISKYRFLMQWEEKYVMLFFSTIGRLRRMILGIFFMEEAL